jgi:alpha-1,4-digalacturonate transport system permease protein
MSTISSQGTLSFLTRRRGGKRLDASDIISYIYLIVGTLIMFGPVVWLVMSSFKPLQGIYQFPPTLLPYKQETVAVKGYDQPLPLYNVRMPDGSVRRLAQISQIGIGARMIDPNAPDEKPIDIKIDQRTPITSVSFEWDNYTGAVTKFPFMTYLGNTMFVTVMATLITLLINSMAAFALSKYQFRGRDAIFVLILSTLMVPITVILVPAFFVLTKVNLTNNLWGLIIPGAATPTGVFLLRQYMLTIPDDLIQSARIDGASEWRIYSQIILPLTGPALAVLAIFSVMWRWNDFLWPLVAISQNELFTLQVGLRAFSGELNQQWNYILAMTVLTLLPISVVFALLERYITTGIATTGMK